MATKHLDRFYLILLTGSWVQNMLGLLIGNIILLFQYKFVLQVQNFLEKWKLFFKLNYLL